VTSSSSSRTTDHGLLGLGQRLGAGDGDLEQDAAAVADHVDPADPAPGLEPVEQAGQRRGG
jgi:hypothetical protein